MATEEGIITKVYSSTAWVKCTKSAACESCSAKGFCDTVGGPDDDLEVEAINAAGAKVDDRVTISFETSSLLKVSFLVYMVPVLFLLLGVIIGDKIARIFNYDQSIFSILVGSLFLFAAFFFVKTKGKNLSKKDAYQPKIIRILR
ncbi:MAG: SoxR reducing system RseC family protein [Desulfobacteraceae bacterium]|nr:SoxR reducing system RseC family protein [Desulfobacteraceae bacterium]MBC2721017.1 SoxR reducing system RseC family protein [Desulfobacteraceae bacterium]